MILRVVNLTPESIVLLKSSMDPCKLQVILALEGLGKAEAYPSTVVGFGTSCMFPCASTPLLSQQFLSGPRSPLELGLGGWNDVIHLSIYRAASTDVWREGSVTCIIPTGVSGAPTTTVSQLAVVWCSPSGRVLGRRNSRAWIKRHKQ
jgi:hypothetical protein